MKKTDTPKTFDRKVKRHYIAAAICIAAVFLFPQVAYAAKTPLESINSLSDFVFAAIKAIGIILLGFGILQLGLSVKSHDASQRANGFLVVFGGRIITFAKEILDMIV